MNKAMQTLIGWAVIFASTAAGILIARLVVPGFHVQMQGFFMAVAAVTFLQMLLLPFVTRLVNKHVPLLAGGVSILSTILGLLIVSLLPNGIRADGIFTWVFAGFIVWLGTGISSAIFTKIQQSQEQKTQAS